MGGDAAELRQQLLERVYPGRGPSLAQRLEQRLGSVDHLDSAGPPQQRLWTSNDVWLIAYADHFGAESPTPLRALDEVMRSQLSELCTGVHVLPFYPSSSDGGFSVVDLEEVDSELGTWEDVNRLAGNTRVMFDAVINHVSTQGKWFGWFLEGVAPYNEFFRTEDPSTDTSTVVRPRTHPLLTAFETASGTQWVWTTFSDDQADLDYSNPEVLFAIVDVLLRYVGEGAGAIRLDAVGFLWKDPSTPSIHLPETHAVIQILRSCIDTVAPGTLLISETNVPHEENVSYFSDEPREVHTVYQFPLAPLTAHAVLTEDTSVVATWADDIDRYVDEHHTFLNFLASHDGVGVRPAEGLLPHSEVDMLADACRSVGGEVSMRSLADGSHRPYELNTTWLDLMTAGDVDETAAASRHLATHAVMLALPGLPGIYGHSFFGYSNDHDGFEASNEARSLNRRRFANPAAVAELLTDPTSTASVIFEGLRAMIDARRGLQAFDPSGRCSVRRLASAGLDIHRHYGASQARCIINLGSADIELADHVDASWEVAVRVEGTAVSRSTPVASAPLPAWSSLWLSPGHERGSHRSAGAPPRR